MKIYSNNLVTQILLEKPKPTNEKQPAGSEILCLKHCFVFVFADVYVFAFVFVSVFADVFVFAGVFVIDVYVFGFVFANVFVFVTAEAGGVKDSSSR